MSPVGTRQRGSILVWFVLGLTTLGAFLAIAVNVGHVLAVRGSLQNGVDSAALAGASTLDMNPTGLATAPGVAVAYAGVHGTDGGFSIVVDPAADVVLGHWDRATNAFTPVPGRALEDARNVNAVQVRGGREVARGNPVPVAFGGAFVPQQTLDVRAQAVAVGGGPCSADCAFPMVFADCDLTKPRLDPTRSDSLCGKTTAYVFHNDWTDNAGLTSLDGTIHASTTSLRNALSSNCAMDDDIATQVDDAIWVENGNNLNPLATYMRAGRVGNVQTSPVVTTANGCAGNDPKFNQLATIVGYTSWILCWATGSQVGPWPPPGWPPSCPAVATGETNTVYIVHLCDYQQPAGNAGVGGCEWFGTVTPRSRLVH
jgi:Flp pilus assembly protein TadG